MAAAAAAKKAAEDATKAAAADAAAAASAARAAREAAAAAATAASGSSEWACSACTFINRGGRMCEICSTPNVLAAASGVGLFGSGIEVISLPAVVYCSAMDFVVLEACVCGVGIFEQSSDIIVTFYRRGQC